MGFWKEAFSEDNGRGSSIRIMAFETLNAGLGLGLYATVSKQADLNTLAFAGSLIAAGLTGKIVGKLTETKVNGNGTTK